MTRVLKFIIASLAAIALGGFIFVANAKAEEKGQGDYQLPVVKVTAEKRESEAQKTPTALTVITGAEIEDSGVRTMPELLERIPNLQISPFTGGINFMSFRGITTAVGTNANPFAMYIDGVPVDTYNTLNQTNLLDVERVEVLRGTQSAIYGKNTLGGIINVITKKPTNTTAGKASASYESYDTYAASASIRGPIKEDVLFYALSVGYDQIGGFMNNENPNTDTNKKSENRNRLVKGQLRYTPSEIAEFKFLLDYYDSDTDRLDITRPGSVSTASIADGDDNEYSTVTNLALSGSLDFDIGTFDTITTARFEEIGYEQSMYYMQGSGDGELDTYRKEYTQEFRLRSPDGKDGISWLVGLYGSYSNLNRRKGSMLNAPFAPGITYSLYNPSREYTTDIAPFGQVDFPLTDALTMTAGLRWHHTHKDFDITTTTVVPAMGMNTAANYKDDHDWSEWLPRLNLKYTLSDDHMLFAGVSRSFVPGGYNVIYMSDNSMFYDAQKAWNFEVGAKTQWLDNKLVINPTIFYSKLEDLQQNIYDPSTNGFFAENAAGATTYGIELDAMYRILPTLTAEFNAGYTHARYDDYINDSNDYSGNHIARTPDFTSFLALQYRNDFGIFARGEVHYTGKMYWNETNEDLVNGNATSPSFGTVTKGYRDPVATCNLRLGYEREDFDFYVYGNNIFGTRYIANTNGIANFTAPIERYGVQLQYKF